MKVLILKVEYDGSGFSGWQLQPNRLTVQGALESAVKSIFETHYNVVGSGRTDAGVHARGQITHSHIDDYHNIPTEKIPKALNSNLPHSIRVIDAAIRQDSFHARFDAVAREYSYTIIENASVFNTHFATYMKYPFDKDSLIGSASVFLGKHDFTTFSKLNKDTSSYICDVKECEWNQIDDNIIRLKIKADRFVYGMVRSLVGAMFDVARGKRSNDEIINALDQKDRGLSSPLAPPQGLILEKIYYEKDIFIN